MTVDLKVRSNQLQRKMKDYALSTFSQNNLRRPKLICTDSHHPGYKADIDIDALFTKQLPLMPFHPATACGVFSGSLGMEKSLQRILHWGLHLQEANPGQASSYWNRVKAWFQCQYLSWCPCQLKTEVLSVFLAGVPALTLAVFPSRAHCVL